MRLPATVQPLSMWASYVRRLLVARGTRDHWWRPSSVRRPMTIGGRPATTAHVRAAPSTRNDTQSRPRPLNQAAVSSLYPLWITGQLGSRRPRLGPHDHQPAWLAQLRAVRPMPYDCPDLMPGEGASCGHAAGAAGAASIASAVRFRGGEQQVGQCPQRQDYETTTGRRQVNETPTSWARTDTPSSAADVPASCCSASAFSCRSALCEQQRLLLCLVLRSSLRRAAAAPPAASRSQFGPTRVLALMARQRGSCTLGRGRWSRWRRSCCSTDAAATWRRPSRRAGHRLLLLGPVHHVPGLIWACTHAAASQWTPRPRSLDAECREGDVIAGAGQLPVGADRPLSHPGDTCISRRRRAVAYRSLLVVFVG